ncbi:hypothetical protein L2E82_01169 [Cichorium intybus]|uniref:Uncharacterized protein n=1 Tax=Cichorium intybus TaxID=13427 RepID=A0ACB9GY83_CICIN|nr:hypothetical protein L2E82_01169 [Cichorium intybus]
MILEYWDFVCHHVQSDCDSALLSCEMTSLTFSCGSTLHGKRHRGYFKWDKKIPLRLPGSSPMYPKT